MRTIFILIPALDDTGPIKGAIALANGLSAYCQTVLVVLKNNKDNQNQFPVINQNVEVISLAAHSGFRGKYISYKKLLQEGSNNKAVSLSLGFSADFLNCLMRGNATIISSVRGNIPKNYFYTYGWSGYPLAWLHLIMLTFFNSVVAISKSNVGQLKRFGISRIHLIGNFIDETSLSFVNRDAYMMKGPVVHFLFLGSLTRRKRPELLIDTARKLKNKGILFKLSVVGDGPLRKKVEDLASKYGLDNEVVFYGHVTEPYSLLQEADYLIMPSESEGVSRAILEALYFGVPCILRDVDASKEVIDHGRNGFLFSTDNDLFHTILEATNKFNPNSTTTRKNLIPGFFRKEVSIKKYLNLIEQ